jgi:hypothetical protein
VISAAENSNKFQKTRFWTEKSVEDAVRLGPMAQATLVAIKGARVPSSSPIHVGYAQLCGRSKELVLSLLMYNL